jgi:hypothetical protein
LYLSVYQKNGETEKQINKNKIKRQEKNIKEREREKGRKFK